MEREIVLRNPTEIHSRVLPGSLIGEHKSRSHLDVGGLVDRNRGIYDIVLSLKLSAFWLELKLEFDW